MRGAKIIEIGRNFEIPPSQDLVVGKKAGSFLATAFLDCRLHESVSEKNPQERAPLGEMFEKAISSSGFPFKVCCLVCPLELKSELDEARAKRSLAETKREKVSGGKHGAEAARIEREIAMWNRQIEKLTTGEKPLEVVFYLSTTAEGLTKDEAMGRARIQANELSIVVGSALSCEVAQLTGEEMKKCFWWEFFTPTDLDELHDEMF
jgi:hypothetical protein